MTDPEQGKQNPYIVRAVYEALTHAPVPVDGVRTRQTSQSKRYTITHRQTLTTTQGTLYIYVENLTNDTVSLDAEPAIVYFDGGANVTVTKNATVDTGTFQSESFVNVDTGSTTTPDASAYRGTADTVTISDTGTPIIEQAIGSGKKEFGQAEASSIGRLRPGDNILLAIENTTTSDGTVSSTMWFHDVPPYEPEL